MKGMLAVVLNIVLTMMCWGLYGVVLHEGQHEMGNSRLRPFICVGLAYFLIAVLIPGLYLLLRQEKGAWTITGSIWSLIAGAAGAVGALGIILAFAFYGKPIYVMPLVFGGAPVVNTLLTMWMAKTFKSIGPLFCLGLALVISGAALVMTSKPAPRRAVAMERTIEGKLVSLDETADGDLVLEVTEAPTETEVAEPKVYEATNAVELKEEHPEAYGYYYNLRNGTLFERSMVIVFVLMTALCWGCYGPVLHKGQMLMQGSRLRPLICVGLAYFLIAVCIPFALLEIQGEPGLWTFNGSLWSLGAGAAGAFGALGIILAFTFGGRPVVVMPLVFGGAPVVNTIATLIVNGNYFDVHPVFYAGLTMVATGAVMVLIFSPKPQKKAAPPERSRRSTRSAPVES
ncbi:Hypothetical protein PBC10988_33950 [Planctomycetales bacterium 10988]|nr:Hypothetical protein PBC10988_33950 [Planctomycetales bacterium 10988]